METQLSDLYTDQDVYEFITTKLFEQNEKCLLPTEPQKCAYRGYKHSDLDNRSIELFGKKFYDLDYTPDGIDEPYQCTVGLKFKLKCAVGHVIHDYLYDSSLETLTIDDDRIKSAVLNSLPNWSRSSDSMKMLYYMQKIHDNGDPDSWENEFDKINAFDENGNWVAEECPKQRFSYEAN